MPVVKCCFSDQGRPHRGSTFELQGIVVGWNNCKIHVHTDEIFLKLVYIS